MHETLALKIQELPATLEDEGVDAMTAEPRIHQLLEGTLFSEWAFGSEDRIEEDNIASA